MQKKSSEEDYLIVVHQNTSGTVHTAASEAAPRLFAQQASSRGHASSVVRNTTLGDGRRKPRERSPP
jgi:hypothetical protein